MDNLPDRYDGEYVDGEIVEGDIWNDCNRHHMRHCLACFPHQPWLRPVDDLAWALAEAQRLTVEEFLRETQKLDSYFAKLMAESRQRRLRLHHRFIWVWWVLVGFYSLGAIICFTSSSYINACLYTCLAAFGACMLLWNHRQQKEIAHGR